MQNDPAAAKSKAMLALLGPLAHNWWLLLLRGLASVAFGVMAFSWPKLTLLTLVVLFAAFVVVDGVFAVAAAVMGKQERGARWWLAVVGLISIGTGIAAYLMPGVTALTFALIIGAWSIATGIFQIIGAIRLRKEIEGEWLLVACGLGNVVFGLLVMLWPGLGLLTMIYLIGFYAIFYGFVLSVLALRLRRYDTLPRVA
jgi:uncharacterized membrane protein HdeD (DUF308 family)